MAKIKELKDKNRRLEKMHVDAQTRALIAVEDPKQSSATISAA